VNFLYSDVTAGHFVRVLEGLRMYGAMPPFLIRLSWRDNLARRQFYVHFAGGVFVITEVYYWVL